MFYAPVFKKKPKLFDLKVIQWVENESREDLSIYKKLMNISAIISAYQDENSAPVTAIKLSHILSTSRQSSQYYVSILSNPFLMDCIKDGVVTTFKIARELSSLKSKDDIIVKIESLKDSHKAVKPPQSVHKSSGKGRKRISVSLGKTTKAAVAQTMVESVLSVDAFKKYQQDFQSTDWTCLNESTSAFQKLIKILEQEIGEVA